MSNQKYPIKNITAILFCHRTSVSRWINDFNEKGTKSLFIAHNPGRPCILSELEEDEICRVQKESPRSHQEMRAYLLKTFNKELSRFTLKNMYKKKDLFGNVRVDH